MFINSDYRNRFFARIGVAMVKIALIGLLLSLLVIGGTFVSFLFVALLLIIAMLTLFTLLLDEGYMNLVNNAEGFGETLAQYSTHAYIIMGICIALLIVSLILINRDAAWKPARNAINLVKVAVTLVAIVAVIIIVSGIISLGGGVQ